MKKILIILAIIITILTYKEQQKNNIIPNNSIRIRVIANSNKISDQVMKLNIKEKVINNLSNKIDNETDITKVRSKIKDSIPELNNIVSTYTDNYNIKYGDNYFPKKELKGITYDEGNYESLVIELGEAQGNNWWCVLFPPICNIDMKYEKNQKINYKSKVLEILNKYN